MTQPMNSHLVCPNCSYQNVSSAVTCNLCSTPLSRKEEEKTQPLLDAADVSIYERQREKGMEKLKEQEKRMLTPEMRWQQTGVIGFFTCFVLSVAFNLPSSLKPFNLLSAGVSNLVFGFSMGYAICRLDLGPIRGIFMGLGFAFLFIFIYAFIGTITSFKLTVFGVIELIGIGFFGGIVTGWHAQTE